MSSAEHSVSLAVSAGHPALAGHFPGAPVAPGVLLLDLVVAAAESWLARRLAVRRMAQVKFHAPLLPEAEAIAHLQLDDDTRLRFRLERMGGLIAEGTLIFEPGIRA
jgi:3-hydroxyacyl-[acyl-carrier-protein] dehydratase